MTPLLHRSQGWHKVAVACLLVSHYGIAFTAAAAAENHRDRLRARLEAAEAER
jgi:hypothetical protein